MLSSRPYDVEVWVQFAEPNTTISEWRINSWIVARET
jgi:hypothetical protein